MSDKAAARPDPSVQEKLLQYRLLGSTIPFKDGGGVVFPDGFPGIGYQLEEWQFERYRARLNRTVLGDAARQRRRMIYALFILFAVAVLAFSFGAPFISNHPAIAPTLNRWGVQLDGWQPLGLIIIAAFVFKTIKRTLEQHDGEQRPQFEDQPKVNRFAYLSRRVLGMIASGQVSVKVQHLRMILGGGIGLLTLALGLSDATFRGENFLLAAILLIYAARPLYFCWTYWSFRMKHRHAPTPADLQPVEPPA